MKKYIKMFFVPLFIISMGFVINYSLFKPSEINFLIANKLYGSPANSAFTDENFYKCVVDTYNRENKDSLPYTTNLSDEQLSTIKTLYCNNSSKSSDLKVESVSGIEKLINLKELQIQSNNLTTLNLNNNQQLTTLYCNDNNLTTLDLTNNQKLTILECNDNKLSYLNVDGLSNLKEISAYHNELSDINLQSNLSLNYLSIYNNSLTNIDLSKNTELISLNLSRGSYYLAPSVNNDNTRSDDADNNNCIENLDLLNNVNLENLVANNICLQNITFSSNNVYKSIQLYDNNLISIDITNLTNLTDLDLRFNQLEELNISNNTSLEELFVNGNKLTSIDLSANINLKQLSVANNNLTNIDVSSNFLLTKLYVYNNQLSNLSLVNNSLLTYVDAQFNNLENINLSNNSKLEHLNVYSNKLTNLDISNNTNLQILEARSNSFNSFDFSNNVNLSRVFIDSKFNKKIVLFKNQVGSIDQTDKLLIKLPENEIYNLTSTEAKGVTQEIFIDEDKFSIDCVSCVGKHTIDAVYETNYKSFPSYTVTYDIAVANIRSDKYIIEYEDNYIYTGFDIDSETIINNIKLSNIENLNCKIENDKYKVLYNDELLKEFDLINISSDKYDLTKDYIFDFDEDILSNINVLNGEKVIENNKIQIKKGEDILQEFDYVNATSDKYDLSSDKIKVQDNNIESLISNTDCTNCSVKVKNNDIYKTSGDFTDGDSLVIMYKDEILKEYELSYAVSGVSLNTNDVTLNLGKKNTFKLETTVLPNSAENKNVIWESSNPSIASVDNEGNVTAHSLGNTTITVKTEEGEFTAECNVSVVEIPTYTVTYPDNSTQEYEENEKIIFKSDLTKEGYKLVGYKYNNKDYKLTDELLMPDYDITLEAIWELVIPDATNNNKYIIEDNYFKNINLETNINNLDLGLDSIYNVKITKDNKEKTNGLIGTGDIINIYLEDTLVTNYTVIIKGDVTGNGKVLIGDVSRAYQYLKKKVSMEDCYVKAADVGQADGVIKVGDISKLYQYLKGKIKEL